jgi:hypothetical protein
VVVVRDTSNVEIIYNAAKLVRLLSHSGINNVFKKLLSYRSITTEDNDVYKSVGLISHL